MVFWFVTRPILGAVTVEDHSTRKHIAHRATHINIHDSTGGQKSACEVTVLSSRLHVPNSYFSLSLV